MAQVEQWITVNGNHVPIMEGQSKADAVKSFMSDKKKGATSRKQSRDEHNKGGSAKTKVNMTKVGNELRKKNSVGLKDAEHYMSHSGSTLHVNMRDYRGGVSAYMSNKHDTGDGISVRASSLSKLEDKLSASGYTKKRGRGEYEYTWSKH